MGLSNALGMAEAVSDGDLTLKQAIAWHLSTNCYPSPPPAMVQVCVEALEACEDEEPDQLISLPVGITWRDEDEVPALTVVSTFRLEAFL